MNKKGYTLIEIIVCIVILGIFSISFVIFNVKQEKKLKEREKIIEKVITSANVFYSENNDLSKTEYYDKSYYVINISDLQDKGILPNEIIDPTTGKNIFLEQENIDEYDEYKDYSRLIVITDNSEDSIGLDDIIYPFEYNYKERRYNLNTLYIEYSENVDCSYGLDDGITIFNKDYKILSTNDYNCYSEETNDYTSLDYNNKTKFSNLKPDYNDVYYYIKADDKVDVKERVFWKFDKYEAELHFFKDMEEFIPNNDDWINKNVYVKTNVLYQNANEIRKISSNIIYKKNDDSTETIENEKIFSKSGIYELYEESTIKSINSDKNLYSSSTEQEKNTLKIDLDDPKIIKKDYSSDKSCMNVQLEDELSGLKDDTIKIDGLNSNDFTADNEFTYCLSSGRHTIELEDNAGNVILKEINTEYYGPILKVEPIRDSVDKFSIELSNSRRYTINKVTSYYQLYKSNGQITNYEYNSYNKKEKELNTSETFYRWNIALMDDTYNEDVLITNVIQKLRNKNGSALNKNDISNLKIKYCIDIDYTGTDGKSNTNMLSECYDLKTTLSEGENVFSTDYYFDYDWRYSPGERYIVGLNENGQIITYNNTMHTDKTNDGYDKELDIYYYDGKDYQSQSVANYTDGYKTSTSGGGITLIVGGGHITTSGSSGIRPRSYIYVHEFNNSNILLSITSQDSDQKAYYNDSYSYKIKDDNSTKIGKIEYNNSLYHSKNVISSELSIQLKKLLNIIYINSDVELGYGTDYEVLTNSGSENIRVCKSGMMLIGSKNYKDDCVRDDNFINNYVFYDNVKQKNYIYTKVLNAYYNCRGCGYKKSDSRVLLKRLYFNFTPTATLVDN